MQVNVVTSFIIAVPTLFQKLLSFVLIRPTYNSINVSNWQVREWETIEQFFGWRIRILIYIFKEETVMWGCFAIIGVLFVIGIVEAVEGVKECYEADI